MKLLKIKIEISWFQYVQHILCNSFSGTTPRGDTGGGQSSACKHEGHRRPASLPFNICRDLQLLGLVMGRELCYLEQLFCTDTLVMLMFDNKRSVIKHNMTNVLCCQGQFLSNVYVQPFPEAECSGGLIFFPPRGNPNILWYRVTLTRLSKRQTKEFLISSHSRIPGS